LGRINIYGYNIPLIDIFACLLVLTSLISKPPVKLSTSLKLTLIFLGYSLINLLIKIQIYGIHSPTPYLYLIRLSALLLLFHIPLNFPKNLAKYLKLAIIANIFFGLFQYILWPDLTYLKSVGWDDHLNRLVSTFFDPTFTGIIYLFFLLWTFQGHQIATIAITFVALALTYSRSTFLALLSSIFYQSFTSKKYYQIIFALLLVFITIVALPRRAGEGTKLERVSSVIAKSANFQEGLELFRRYPLTGIGYNNVASFKKGEPSSHSIGGYDSSLLNILITGGVIGFILFFFAGHQIFASSPNIVKTMFIALIIHSLFANSLFYPHSTILLAFIYHLEQKAKYRK
jgi:hypothetical protein